MDLQPHSIQSCGGALAHTHIPPLKKWFVHADFLDILVAVGFLDREGRGEAARYMNSREASAFLVKGRPDYMGDAFILSHDRCGPHRFTSKHTTIDDSP